MRKKNCFFSELIASFKQDLSLEHPASPMNLVLRLKENLRLLIQGCPAMDHKQDYKQYLNLPQTTFSMRANSAPLKM